MDFIEIFYFRILLVCVFWP